MSENLEERLIGAWELCSYEEKSVEGDEIFYPLGKNPKGIILYTSDGYMSAQLMRGDRPSFASGDWFDGTPEEYKKESSSYIAYSGPFTVDEQKDELTHSMYVSLFPNWTGQSQPRAVKIEGNNLYLSTVSPIHSGGKTVKALIHWKRAGQNR